MLLRELHIACFVANWNDKAGNLRDIAMTLSIGLDSRLPRRQSGRAGDRAPGAAGSRGTGSRNRPGGLSCDDCSRWLSRGPSFSEEDRQRAEMYRANAERREAQASVTNLAEYLASLEMVTMRGRSTR